MERLYEVIAEIEALYDDLESEDGAGELPIEEIKRRLDALEFAADEKLTHYWRSLKNWSAQAEAIEAEEKRLRARRHTLENRVASLKAYVGEALGAGNKWKAPDGVAAFSWRKSEAVKIENEDRIPDAWCVFERKPVLTEIKQTLKEGGEVPGARLETRQHVQVR